MESESPVREIRINYKRPFSVIFSSGKTPPPPRQKRIKKSHVSPQSDILIPALYKAWRDIGGEITFVCEQAVLDQIDEHGMKEQLWAATALQEKLSRLKTAWPRVDCERVRGILVTALAPLDKQLINWNLHLNAILKEGFQADRRRWTSFMNSVKSLTPPLPKEILTAIDQRSVISVVGRETSPKLRPPVEVGPEPARNDGTMVEGWTVVWAKECSHETSI